MHKPDYKVITACIGDNPKQQRWRDHPEWGATLLRFHASDPNLYIGAYEEEKLVGCMIAHAEELLIRGTSYKAAVIAITEVVTSHRGRGIASKMLDRMLEQVEKLQMDLVLAFQTAGRGGKNILKRAGFSKIHKHAHAGKVLDKDRMDNLMALNPVLRKIALKIIDSSIGETNPSKGKIRFANSADLHQIVDLLNRETERLDIASIWTLEYLQRMMDWRYKIFVLEEEGDILGALIGYEEVATLGKDYFISGLLKEMVYQDEVKLEDRVAFLNHALSYFKGRGIPSVSYPYPKNVDQVIKKAGFNILPSDERTTFLKPLSEAAKELPNVIPKFKYVNVFLIC